MSRLIFPGVSGDEHGRHRIGTGRGSCLAQQHLVWLMLAALACCFSLPAAAANDPQVLQVTQLKAQPSESERQDARNAFQKRQAIVVMTEGDLQDFGRLLGAQITDTKAFSKKGRSPSRRARR